MKCRLRPRGIIALVLAGWVPATGAGSRAAEAQTSCDARHIYIGNRPKEANPGWHEEAQGIAHDDTHWYITQKDRLWKIPGTRDLASDVECKGDILCKDLEDTDLGELGYDHLGDLTYHRGFLCIAVEFPDKEEDGVLAIFAADDLGLVARHPLPELDGTAGWCAIDRAGFAYLSQSTVTSLARYEVNWDALPGGQLEVEPAGTVFLFDEAGDPFELSVMQGGAFSDDGLLYLINGDATTDCDGCGIHVFEVNLSGSAEPCSSGPGDCRAVRIDRSQNGELPFNYEYNPGSVFNREEPEGITYWDLTAEGAPSAPGITSDGQPVASSQLHALMLDNDITNADDIYVKHYQAVVECEATQYAAKIVCGTQSERNQQRFERGLYATTINVHNPHKTVVTFAKRLALAIPPGEQRPGKVLPIAEDRLGPDEALAIDCPDLERRLFPSGFPAAVIDGFLVIEATSRLDVTAVYTAGLLDDRGQLTSTSIDVEPVAATPRAPR